MSEDSPLGLHVLGDGTTEVHVVYTSPCVLSTPVGRWPIAQMWVLEDRTVLAIVPTEDNRSTVRLSLGMADEMRRESRKNVVIVLADESGTITLTETRCACGSPVNGVGPVDNRWRMIRVRPPRWATL